MIKNFIRLVFRNLFTQFASRIDLSLPVFSVIASGAIIIALVTVSFQAFKASLINPVVALKVE
jgi:putative ABC transport system permease protein